MLLFILLSCLFIDANAYKILVHSPTLTRSHMISAARVGDVLHRDGHNVTVMELHYAFVPGSIDSVQSANLWKYTFDWPRRPKNFLPSERTGNILHEPTVREFFDGKYSWHEMMADCCATALKNGSLLEEIRRQKFDVIITEQLEWCGQAISHLVGIKTRIWLSSCPLMEHQRVEIPDLMALAASSPLIFTNVDEFLTFPRPMAANVINIGGLGLSLTATQPPLKSPFKELMEKGEKGVIYFALGSVLPTNHLPSAFRKNMFQAFGNLKDYQFIVKISDEDQESRDIAKLLPNIYVTTWAPQPSIMAHSRLRLLIAHGGFNSLLEAARYGIPSLLIPLANDGYQNARLVERNQWGLYFEKKHLLHSHKEFQDAIEHILTNPSFKEKALRTQKLFLNKPMSSEDKLTKYVRLLEMANGNLQELQSIAYKLSFVELYNLDVYSVVFLSVDFYNVCCHSVNQMLGKEFAEKKIDPDDFLNKTENLEGGHFVLTGTEDEIFSISPYLKIKHRCDVVDERNCYRVTEFEVPQSKLGGLYDLTYVSLNLRPQYDYEYCE
ncbi:Glucuronosyltransferase [Aphelenchoides bicaudatus]|nr:Glucuronosyltransferase [Aphelenchoides bicaudatus]